MVATQTPVDRQQLGFLRSCDRPGSTGQWCDQLTQGEVGTLDESGLDLAGEAEGDRAFTPALAGATADA